MRFRLRKKRSFFISAAVTAFIVIFLIINKDLFLDPELELENGQTLYIWAFVCAGVISVLTVLRIEFTPKWEAPIHALIFILFLPLATFQLVEAFNGKLIWNYSNKTFWMNYVVYLSVYVLVFLISQRVHLTSQIVITVFLCWALTNDVLVQFRETPFVPFDFTTASTGMAVADGYSYELSWQFTMGCLIFGILYLFNRNLKDPRPKKRFGKIMTRVIPSAYIVAFVLFFYVSNAVTSLGYKPDFWNQARGYRRTGSFFNFALNTRYILVTAPDGYKSENITEIIDSALEEYGVDPSSDISTNLLTGENDYTASADGELPNIICIMNEAFSDLEYTSQGKLELNKDNMPFIHSLTDNTIKGYVSVSVFGSGTSNTEYEFLSGNSVSFLPTGSNVYQLYIKNEIPTLVSEVKSLGYSVTAFHPYYRAGWNRESVYELMGFDDFISLENFVDEDIIETYKANNSTLEYDRLLHERYPENGQMLLRRFISDSYDAKMVVDMYEQQQAEDADTPFFIHNVTMQNHGGYAVNYSNFDQNVHYTNLTGQYDDANRYLSLIEYTDEAFEELVEYFENVDEKTVIVMYGDHLPSLDDAFYEEIFGTAEDMMDIEQEQMRYRTPFVIWANYDIDEAELDTISANYLSTLVTQVAGLPQTDYQKYLSVLYQSLPVINSVGYIGSDGNYYSYDDTSEYDETLNKYYQLEYNSLIDADGRVDEVFNLE